MKITVNESTLRSFGSVQKVIRDRMAAMQNWRTPMKHISMIMYKAVLMNFRTQGARVVDGGWVPLSPVTIARRRKGRGSGSPKILQDKGALIGANVPYADDNTASVSNNMPYAVTMQRGRGSMVGHVKPYKRKDGVKVRAHTTRLPAIPARPFMLLNADDVKMIKRTAMQVLQGRL